MFSFEVIIGICVVLSIVLLAIKYTRELIVDLFESLADAWEAVSEETMLGAWFGLMVVVFTIGSVLNAAFPEVVTLFAFKDFVESLWYLVGWTFGPYILLWLTCAVVYFCQRRFV